MPRGAEGDALCRMIGIGAARVILGDEPRHVDEEFGGCRPSREGVECLAAHGHTDPTACRIIAALIFEPQGTFGDRRAPGNGPI